MGSKEAKKNNRLVDQERSRGIQEHSTAMGYLQPERMKEKGWADTTRDEIMGGYRKFAGGDFSGAGGGSFGAGGGGYAPHLTSLVGTLADARDRYKGFADTGGYTEADKGAIRQRGLAPISGMFEGLKRRMEQQRSAGQASNIGFGDSLQRLAREQSRAAGDTALNTELGIKDRVLGNQKWGLEGYTGIGGMEQNIESENAAARNAAAAQGAASGGANERFNLGMRMDALDRMADMYGSTAGELSRYDQNLMAERDMASQQFQGSNQQRMNYNPNVSAWDRAMQVGGLVAGGASGLMGGGLLGGGIRSPRLPGGQNLGKLVGGYL